MSLRARRAFGALVAAIALAAGAVSAVGVLLRGDGATVVVESPRGERYPMVTTGAYAWNPQRLVAEGVGWDVFTLAIAAPALLLAVPALLRGSVRARLAVLGLLAYVFYQYLMYALSWAFGPLFLPFVAIYAAALVALVWLASTLSPREVAARASQRFPARGVAVLCFLLSAVLAAMWLARIAAGLRGDLAGAMLLGETTLVVQALDLGLIVPLAVFTGVVAWRRRPLGVVLAAVFLVKAVAMACAICAMLVSAWRVEGRLDLGALSVFGCAAAAAAWLAARTFASVQDGAPAHPSRDALA